MTEPSLITVVEQPFSSWSFDMVGLRNRLLSILPIGRYFVWLVAGLTVLGLAVFIRLDVQQLRKDLDRNERAQHHAVLLNQRLQLEIDARRRSMALKKTADAIGLSDKIRVVRVGALR